MKNGSITYRDLAANKEYPVKNLNLTSALMIAGETLTLPSLRVSGTALENIPFSIDSERLSLDQSKGALSAPKVDVLVLDKRAELQAEYNLKSSNADGRITFKEVSHSVSGYDIRDASGVVTFALRGNTATAKSEKVSLSLNQQPVAVSFDSVFDLASQALNVRPFKVDAFSGATEGAFSLNLASANKPFTAKTSTAHLDIGKAMSIVPQKGAVQVVGTLERLKTDLRGELGGDVKSALNGNVDLDFKNGQLQGINIAGLVIRSVDSLPFSKGGLYPSVPEESRPTVDSPNTNIKSLTGSFAIGGSALQTQNLNIVSDLFALEGKGRVGFDTSLDVTATIYFEPKFSESLAQRTKELQNLLDAKGRLTFPLAISGVPPKLVVIPNIEKLLEVAGRRMLEQKAGDLLEKGLKQKGLGKFLGF